MSASQAPEGMGRSDAFVWPDEEGMNFPPAPVVRERALESQLRYWAERIAPMGEDPKRVPNPVDGFSLMTLAELLNVLADAIDSSKGMGR